MSVWSDLGLPELEDGVLRTLFLYVGQGESTLLFVPEATGGHKSMLVDSNRAPGAGGIDLARLVRALLPPSGVKGDDRVRLDLFVNTHPHKDHLCGLEQVREVARIGEVWHSGHKPGPEHDGAYQQLKALLKEVKDRGGNEVQLEGSRDSSTFGLAEVHVVSPADYIVDDVNDEKPEDRYKRIHDQCAVLRIGHGTAEKKTRILLTGDADKTAWQRITGYHGKANSNRIAAQILSAPHHGSNTTFRDNDDDEVYTGQLDAIAPERVVISSPDKKDSPHGHPDDFALSKYEDEVGADNVHHLGSRAWSFVADIYSDGSYDCYWDKGELAKSYGLDSEDDKEKKSDGGGSGPTVISRVEKSRPMG